MKVSRTLLPALAASLCLIYGSRPPSPLTASAEPSPQASHREVEQAEDVARRGRELLALGERQNYEDHALALGTATEALALMQAAGDAEGSARAYALVARCHHARSDLAEASRNYEEALRIWRELNKPLEQADVLILLGFAEARKGEWQNSISFLTQAEELIADRAEPAQLGQIASGLGHVFSESGLPERGLAQYQRALDFYRQTPDARDDALTILEIGSTHHRLDNHAEALSYLRQALSLVPAGGLDAAQCHHYLGRVYGSIGEHEAALSHLQSALPIYARAGNLREWADAFALIGQINEQQGRLKSARRHYLRAAETFTRVSDRINQAAVYHALGRLGMRDKNYAAAEDYLRRSVEVTENIRRVPASTDLTAAFSATIHERYESYVECLMRQHDLQPSRRLDVRAFEASDLTRGRSLAEMLRATQTDLALGLDPELARREKSLRQALRVKEDSKVALLGGQYRTEDLRALDSELARLEAAYEQVNEAIRALRPTYGQITRPEGWGLARIQKQVVADDQTVLLEFLLGAERSYAWAVTRDSVRSYNLPGRAQINGAVEKVYRLLSSAPDAETAGEAGEAIRELSDLVLSPVAEALKNKSRLIVVADGALNLIPFQVLTVPASGDEPAVASYEIVNAPSATILGELREEAARRRPASKLLAAFGHPAFAPPAAPHDDAEVAALRDIELRGDSFDPATVRPLFYARRELSHLLDVTAGRETFVAAGYDATRERLLGTDLSHYAILHFATHGLLDPERPENSGLLLSTVGPDGRALNGFVGLRNVYELRAPVNLVVLSACRTALGKNVRGEGMLGLTRGFMYAGASSVVASLWKVDDEATAELMRQFYANMLRDGATPSAALRAAQNSIRQRPEWRAPYYWAAFTLQGEYRQVIPPAPAAAFARTHLPAAVGFMLALSAGVSWVYRRRRRRVAQA